MFDQSLADRITKTGDRYLEVMEHLKRLELSRKIEETGTNVTGQLLRTRLREIYNIDTLAFGTAVESSVGSRTLS